MDNEDNSFIAHSVALDLRTIEIVAQLWGHTMRLFFIGWCFALLFTGCAVQKAVSPDFDNASVMALAGECVPKTEDSIPITPYTYLKLGFSRVRAQCKIFFDGLTDVTRNAKFSRRALSAGQAGATSMISVTNGALAAAKAIAITAAGTVLADQLIQDFADSYAFSQYIYKVETLVKSAMDQFEAEVLAGKPEWRTDKTKGADNYCVAFTYVRDYASLCSLSTIQSRFDQLIAAPVVVVPVSIVRPIITQSAVPTPGMVGPDVTPRTTYDVKAN